MSVTIRPPHSCVSTFGRPKTPPMSRKNAMKGRMMKSTSALRRLNGAFGISIGISRMANVTITRMGRQRSSIG
ncbi:hypothetical protein D3C86_1099030 [compost metagenome]